MLFFFFYIQFAECLVFKSWKDVTLCQLLFLHLLRWFSFFILLMNKLIELRTDRTNCTTTGREEIDHRHCGGKGALVTEKGKKVWNTQEYMQGEHFLQVISWESKQEGLTFMRFCKQQGSKTWALEVPGLARIEIWGHHLLLERNQTNSPGADVSNWGFPRFIGKHCLLLLKCIYERRCCLSRDKRTGRCHFPLPPLSIGAETLAKGS